MIWTSSKPRSLFRRISSQFIALILEAVGTIGPPIIGWQSCWSPWGGAKLWCWAWATSGLKGCITICVDFFINQPPSFKNQHTRAHVHRSGQQERPKDQGTRMNILKGPRIWPWRGLILVELSTTIWQLPISNNLRFQIFFRMTIIFKLFGSDWKIWLFLLCRFSWADRQLLVKLREAPGTDLGLVVMRLRVTAISAEHRCLGAHQIICLQR